MTCEHIEELLSAYIEGELGAAEKTGVESHLAACPACAKLLAGLREVTGAMASFPAAEPSPTLLARLYGIPERKAEKKKRLRPVFDSLTRPALQPVYAAFTILFVALSFVLFHPGGSGIRKQIDLKLHRGIGTVEKLYAEAGTIKGELEVFSGNVVKSFKSLDLLKDNEDKQ